MAQLAPTEPPVAEVVPPPVQPIASSDAVVTSLAARRQPLVLCPSLSDSNSNAMTDSLMGSNTDKKSLKRAANRRSAQLSRKRKKQYIEELKEENEILIRKEHILRNIPDLIVVFDSAGSLGFISHSVGRFLDFTPSDLEGTSFWERLCDESVRLLKAAFMDALAARTKDSDTVPLGSGAWDLRLVNKDGTHKPASLNGVVHFSGDAPECVCSIRPRESLDDCLHTLSELGRKKLHQVSSSPQDDAIMSITGTSNGGGTMSSVVRFKPNVIRPQQSVTDSIGSSDDASSVRISRGKVRQQRINEIGAQISDNESIVSA